MNTISTQAPTLQVPLTPKMPDFGTGSIEGPSFLEIMGNGIQEVNTIQNTADAGVTDLLTGKDVDSAEVLTTVQKADMAFRLLQQVRNKLVEAYREISQMQI